jgi:lipopolysaccharide biosynthesis protein
MVDVYLWMYHEDLWSEFYRLLYPIKDKIVLHLGMCKDNASQDIHRHIIKKFPYYNITIHPNAGGDILPFITDFARNPHKQNLFIKLHAKKSKLLNRIEWRNILLHSLIGQRGQSFDSNVKYLEDYPDIGLITTKGLLFQNQETSNTSKINEILQYYGISRDSIKKKKFAAGTMFIARSCIYNKFLNLNSLDYLTKKLSFETGYVTDHNEGKYCHSLERIFGYFCEFDKHNTSSCVYATMRIINTQVPMKYLHLSITYSGLVFLEENLLIHGRLLDKTKNTFTIEWHHLSSPYIRTYIESSRNVYIGQ